MLASTSFDGLNLTSRLSCDKGVMGGKKWSSCCFLEESPKQGWPKSSLDGLVTKIDNGLPTDRIIDRSCQWSVRTTAKSHVSRS